MVTSVNTNVNALAAVQALNDISNQLTTTQAAIQSGYKVGSASDNPAVFTIAQGLRANVDALSAVSDSLSTGTATLQAQTQGATSISNALGTLLQTVTQGTNTTDPAQVAAINQTITNTLSNIDAYANATTINGVNLLATSGTLNVLKAVDGSSVSVTTSTASTSAGLGLSGLQLSTGETTLSSTTTAPAAGDTIKFVNSAGVSTYFEFTSGAALTTAPGSGNTVVGVSLGTTASDSIGNLLSALQGKGIAASEDSSGNITVGGGTTTESHGSSFSVSSPSANNAITLVKDAINAIGTTLANLGAATSELQGLSDFTSQLSNSVTTGLGALVDANLSDESAKLSSLQTKQSLAIQSLSLANQGPSALLQLFR